MQETMETTQAMIDHLAAVNKILEKNNYSEGRLIPILQEVQAVYKYLSKDMISYVATSIGVPPSRVYGVATFYAHCHVKKSHSILHALYEKLKLSDEKRTTDDLLFTVETVSCLGACGLAPVMLVNDSVHGQMTPEKTDAIIDQVIAEEKAANQ